MVWQKRSEASEFKFVKKGDMITGQLIDMKTTRYESKSYTVLLATGESKYFFGCYRLDSILPPLLNRYISLTYLGKKKISKGQSLRDFNVEVWSTDDGTPPEGFEVNVPF